MLVRCWLAAWATFILLLPSRSGNALGNAGFLGLVASFIVPPSVPVQLFVFLMSTMVVGMSFGWAVGAAAMKAALSARSQSLLSSQLARANDSVAGAVDPNAVFQLDLFRGQFLDWRSSIVFGFFFAFASFCFAMTRAYIPKLSILCVFGSIVTDVFCTFGPLFPTANYTLVASFLISVGCYIAIALVCILLIFPETMSHAHLTSVSNLLRLLQKLIEGQDAVLAETPEKIAQGVEDRSSAAGRSIGLRERILMSLQALTSKNALVEFEFSYGRWNGSDCKSLEDPLKLLIARTGAFQAFPCLISNFLSSMPPSRSAFWASSSSSQVFPSLVRFPTVSQPDGIHDTGTAPQIDLSVLSLPSSLSRLRAATTPLRESCRSTLVACYSVIEDVNQRRWPWSKPQREGPLAYSDLETKLDTAIEELKQKRASFIDEERPRLTEVFTTALPSLSVSSMRHALHATTPLRVLIVSLSYAAQLVVIADAIISLAELIRAVCLKRRKCRLWAPRSLRALGKWLISRGKEEGDDELGKNMGEDTTSGSISKNEGKVGSSFKTDPDSRPPSNVFQKMMNSVYRTYVWFKTPEAIYVWKYVTMSVLLWLPSVVSASAEFYYAEKGVWALIMAQTVLNVYASDQLYNLVNRLLGALAGMVAGLLIWYVGNGNGKGNPYGMAASAGVFLIPIVYLRINTPPSGAVPLVMFCVTVALILGYSWIDGHLATVGNQDIGWPIGWKRTVLAIIGCVASFAFMMIPPTSGRKAVRMRNAAIISELASIYTLLMSAWINEDGIHGFPSGNHLASTSTIVDKQDLQARDEEKPPTHEHGPKALSNKHHPDWFVEFRGRVIPLAQRLRDLHAQTMVARWEGSVRGAWPIKEYLALVSSETEALASLSQLASALSHLSASWRMSLIQETLVLNPDFMAEVTSVFTLVSQSLRTGEPLHQAIPSSLRDRLFYHHARGHPLYRNAAPKFESESKHTPIISDTITEVATSEVGITVELPGKSYHEERIKDENFMYFASAVSAVSQVVSSLEVLRETTKSLCGETPFAGFEEWRNVYGQSRMGNIQ
ncbi:hypothetical protein M0805_002170 [Coniferiporia weirii]|nr:hypothetical protein M0805_002170 [Coniferiporia weirii]